jgi:hypothetical protein
MMPFGTAAQMLNMLGFYLLRQDMIRCLLYDSLVRVLLLQSCCAAVVGFGDNAFRVDIVGVRRLLRGEI